MWYVSYIDSKSVNDRTYVDNIWFNFVVKSIILTDEETSKSIRFVFDAMGFTQSDNIHYILVDRSKSEFVKKLDSLGIESVFGLNLDSGSCFVSSDWGLKLYSSIEFKHYSNKATSLHNVYKNIVFSLGGDYFTLESLIKMKRYLKVNGDSFTLFNVYTYDIVNKSLFTKLFVLRR